MVKMSDNKMHQNRHLLSTDTDRTVNFSPSSYLLEDLNSTIPSKEQNDNYDDKVSGSSSKNGEAQEKYSDSEYALHSAAETGKVNLLRRLLLHGDPLITDTHRKTPLHYACGFAYQKKALKMLNMILRSPHAQNTPDDEDRKRRLIDFQDENGETALHIAARTEHRLVVEKLLHSSADVNLRDVNNIEPLQLIYGKVPAAMKHIFDGAIECKIGDQNDENLIAQFDFGVIIGHDGPTDKEDALMFQMETGLISYCLQQTEKKREEILLHPIVQVFLFLKWKKIRVLLWISVLLHVLWLLLSSLFITDLYLCQCPYIKPDNEMVTCEIGLGSLLSLNILATLAILSSVFVAIKKLYEIFSTPQLMFYMRHIENVGQWTLITVLVILCTPIFNKNGAVNNEIIINSSKYPVAAFAIILAWSLILCQIGKIPRFGTFIEMLVKVMQSFVMFMVTFSSLFVAFILCFQIMMPEKDEFKTFPWGVAKIMVMMIGEFEYDQEFYSKESSTGPPFPTSTKLLYAIFMTIITIILYNLLIGLTLCDIQGLEKGAQLSSLSRQLEQISMMEKFVMCKRIQKWLIRFKKIKWIQSILVTQQVTDPNTNMKVDLRVCELPPDLQTEVRKVAAPNVRQASDGEEDDTIDNTVFQDNSLDNYKDPQESVYDVTHAPAINLREQIKNVLAEIVQELQTM